MTNVVQFKGYTTLDIEPNNVLEAAKDQCKHVLVLGFYDDGLPYVASSTPDVGKMLRMIELFKFKLMRGDFD